MLPGGIEPTISAGERPQTYALDRADTGTGAVKHFYKCKYPTGKKGEEHFIWTCAVSGNGTISRCFARRVKLAVVVLGTRITGL